MPGARPPPGFNEARIMPQLAEACVQHRFLAQEVPQTLLEAGPRLQTGAYIHR